jgi:phosphoribosylamine--glycine ligase
LTDSGPQVLEFNVRLGDPETQPIMMRLRSDLADLLLAAHARQLSTRDAHWTPNPSVCVVLCSRGYPGKFERGKVITGYEEAEAVGGVKLFHAGTKFSDHQLVTTGGRVLGVTAAAEDLPAAIQRVYSAVDKIHFEGMHFRRDVGAKPNRRPKAPGAGKPSPKRGKGFQLGSDLR